MNILLLKPTTFIILIVLFLIVSPKIFASNIVINEFLVSPSNTQWVELYNKGEETIDISRWIIDDSGGTEKYIIDIGITLPRKRCISFQSGKFNFNTSSSDSARLIVDNEVIDSYSYEKSPGDNISFGRSTDGDSNWITFSNPSRDRLNNSGEICLIPTSIPTPIPTSTQTNTPAPTATTKPKPSSTPKPQSKTTANTIVIPPNTPAVILTSISLDKSKQITSSGSQTDEVLGEFASKEIISGEGTEETTKAGSKSNYPILAILLIGGVVCFFTAAVISIRKIKKRENKI